MITGIILAAGFSRRMNKNKLLLEIDGIPIIEKVMNAAVNSSLDEILLIYRESSIKEIADKFNMRSIVNENADIGQSQSVKLGVQNANFKSEAYVFLTGDQPFITSEVINKILQLSKDHKERIIVPLYNDKRGNPVLFPSRYKEKLLELDGDIGGRKIIEAEMKNVYFEKMSDIKAGLDIDTWEEYSVISKLF